MNQDDLHKDMIGRKKAVRVRYLVLQQQLDEQQQLEQELHHDGHRHIEQYDLYDI